MSSPARWFVVACLLTLSLRALPVLAIPPEGTNTPAPRMAGPAASPARLALTKKAADGDPAAQFSLGVALLQGDFGASDPADGLSWVQAAANQGHAPAMARLGRIYRDGIGVPPDPYQAVEWFRVAGEAGFLPARVDLALMIAAGKGSHQDQVEAWALLESASASLTLAPPGEYDEARRVLADLGRRLTPEQTVLARRRLEDIRQQALTDLMRRHPGMPKKRTPSAGAEKTPVPGTR
ncbi:MAG: sel1 repeat family protein [Candidatus Riflebacteria bacterium]|nr:sel1 repeat family protein [Candidatus Riflebacteria bacterium]